MNIIEKMNNYNVTEDLLEIFEAQLSFWMLVILMFSGTTFVPTKEQAEAKKEPADGHNQPEKNRLSGITVEINGFCDNQWQLDIDLLASQVENKIADRLIALMSAR